MFSHVFAKLTPIRSYTLQQENHKLLLTKDDISFRWSFGQFFKYWSTVDHPSKRFSIELDFDLSLYPLIFMLYMYIIYD